MEHSNYECVPKNATRKKEDKVRSLGWIAESGTLPRKGKVKDN